jgi:hypothetical protein
VASSFALRTRRGCGAGAFVGNCGHGLGFLFEAKAMVSRQKNELTGWLESDDLLATRHSWFKVASQISKAANQPKGTRGHKYRDIIFQLAISVCVI